MVNANQAQCTSTSAFTQYQVEHYGATEGEVAYYEAMGFTLATYCCATCAAISDDASSNYDVTVSTMQEFYTAIGYGVDASLNGGESLLVSDGTYTCNTNSVFEDCYNDFGMVGGTGGGMLMVYGWYGTITCSTVLGCILNAEQEGYVVYHAGTSDELVLWEGFRFRNGMDALYPGGAGMWISDGAIVELRQCHFMNNVVMGPSVAGGGAAISIAFAELTLYGTRFSSNRYQGDPVANTANDISNYASTVTVHVTSCPPSSPGTFGGETGAVLSTSTAEGGVFVGELVTVRDPLDYYCETEVCPDGSHPTCCDDDPTNNSPSCVVEEEEEENENENEDMIVDAVEKNKVDIASKLARVLGVVSAGAFFLIIVACHGARCAGKAPHLSKVGVVDHLGVFYSTFDWGMDLFAAAEMYEAGGASFGKTAMTICGIHVAANAVGVFLVVHHEKKKDNIDVAAFSNLNLMVTGVQLVALTNLKVIAGFVPWKTLRYKGCPSRRTYMLCNMIPLVFENIPQFVNQLMFMIWIGDTSNMITTVSTMGSGLAILFQLMRSLSQGMVVQDEHFATPKQVAPAPDDKTKETPAAAT
ncbi:hypothetical protein TeGR_g2371 [Tetraparma gracilis]|uniref:Uncharacterized protein n=1 Tax=Tetraparma gracilis TaxID=2962635 RepID=A0ABQ6NDZ9_9STRA|nr:hypothetical protein TeGR_g2371 [Tetraparma gracilis]